MTASNMPAPPPRPRIELYRCGALADCSDTSRKCGKDALLYACGWRCDDHRPGAQ
ncbi:hypothetical protein GCM10023085_45820 [Actinomadura viridis]|uniref:Uncharacterized protein n=1 Tax=Actinomadura viridis TaxID=58110 RepID=A0A931GK55_9ACTN|nr:hypothetical protein [Actinomadura viridis]MBG6089942.1 hypothetical protein [Actinomadura viridis]